MSTLQVSGFTEQIASEIISTIDHIEGNHADTAQFIATDGMERDGVTGTSIDAIDPSGIEFTVTGREGPVSRRIDFDQPVASMTDLQVQVFALLGAAREASPDHPITSIERELAERGSLTTYVGEVTRVERLTPTLTEVTIGGLHQMPSVGGDEYFYVVIPNSEHPEHVRSGMTMKDIQAIPEGEEATGAAYTTRRRRPAEGEIDLWIVLHGHEGGVSGWAAADAAPGATVGLWGPRSAYDPPASTTRHLLVCDESGLAACCAIIEQLDPEHPATLVIEVADDQYHPPLPAHEGLDIVWAYRDGAEPGNSNVLFERVNELNIQPDGLFAFGAAESREITKVRKLLRNERGLSSDQVHLTGYWRR